jgi:hypothetical protein
MFDTAQPGLSLRAALNMPPIIRRLFCEPSGDNRAQGRVVAAGRNAFLSGHPFMTVLAVNSPSFSPMATACPFCVSGIVTESTRTATQIQYVCGECHRRWFEVAERPWYPSAATKISEAP